MEDFRGPPFYITHHGWVMFVNGFGFSKETGFDPSTRLELSCFCNRRGSRQVCQSTKKTASVVRPEVTSHRER